MLSTLETFLLAAFFGVSVTLFATSVVLAILHYYRIISRNCNNQHDNRPTINHVLLQRPPTAHFYPPICLSRQASTVDEYPCFICGGNEKDIPRQMEVGVQEGSHGDTSRARLPFIQLSPDSSSCHESAGHTPHPAARNAATASDLARYLVRLGLGNASPRGSPTSEQHSLDNARSKRIPDATIGPTDILIDSTSELDVVWDNLNLP